MALSILYKIPIYPIFYLLKGDYLLRLYVSIGAKLTATSSEWCFTLGLRLPECFVLGVHDARRGPSL